ncbi:MAG TPA: corrinoid protein [bacterium]|nr:corrinoid protein [bacterium]HOC89025.1 corrinoid protein [bacterium]HOZ21838.1 corrinoid protein [bacterium]
MSVLEMLAESVITGNANRAEELTLTALGEGIEPSEVLNKGLIAAMDIVGVKFRNNEFYVPEMLVAARAMKAGIKVLKPKLVETGVEPIGRFIIGTVKGDLHDIGKNLVSMMMEGAGFEVIDLGVDVTADKFVAAIKEYKPQVVGLSALLTTTMLNMKDALAAFEAAGVRDQVKVVIGGAPVTLQYAREINADGYAADAASAVDLVKQLLPA